MSKKIVVVGSINLDLVARVARMPAEGETLTSEGFAMAPGGKGANQAVGASRLGGEVEMVGRLGRDGFGETLRQGLTEAGVGVLCVEDVDASSGVALITVSGTGGNAIVVVPGANAELRPDDLDDYEEEFRGAGIILTQLEVPMETVKHLGRIAARLKAPLMLDPAPARELGAELLRAVTWLTPNEGETRALLRQLGHAKPEDLETDDAIAGAAAWILAAGARNVALKLGERGVYVAGQDVAGELIPSFAVEAVDTTGAGDAFNAGLAYGLMEGLEARAAARFASAVAALSVTRNGAQSSMPSLAEVKRLLEERGSTEIAG
jgi:ribokinase